MTALAAAPPRAALDETRYRSLDGYVMVFIAVLLIGASALIVARQWAPPALAGVLAVAGAALVPGLYMLQPNEAKVLTLFGRYMGTDRRTGLRWTNPFQTGTKISLRARNLNTSTMKVNDKRGNPVEIGAAVVWRVRDTARAVFEIDDLHQVRQHPGRGSHPPPGHAVRLRQRRGPGARRDHAARRPGRGGRRTARRPEPALRHRRRGGARRPAHAPGLRTRDRPGDAAAPAGHGHRQRTAPDRGWRGGHGRGRAETACPSATC